MLGKCWYSRFSKGHARVLHLLLKRRRRVRLIKHKKYGVQEIEIRVKALVQVENQPSQRFRPQV